MIYNYNEPLLTFKEQQLILQKLREEKQKAKENSMPIRSEIFKKATIQ